MIRYFTSIVVFYKVQILVSISLLFKHDEWLLKLLGSEEAEVVRGRFGIHAFLGENGSGKTNVMVRQALRFLDRGKVVISTVPLYIDKANGILHPNYRPFTSWVDLLDAKNCVLLMDEMTGIANARENTPLPGIVQLILNQLRKRKMIVLWSSPAWEDAQAQIRRLTRAVTVCKGSWSDKSALKAQADATGDDWDEAWIPNRLFHARTYRKAGTTDVFKQQGHVPVVSEWYWGPGSKSFEAYDTNEETSRLGMSNDFGQCLICEGTRRRHECSCDDYIARKPARRSAAAKHDHQHALA